MKLVVLALSLVAASAAAANPLCKSRLPVVGACFTVHGRIEAYNGSPTFRIHPNGSRRILGVEDNNGDPGIPDSLRAAFQGDAFAHPVDADFQLCPVSKPRADHMQFVCITGASHITQAR